MQQRRLLFSFLALPSAASGFFSLASAKSKNSVKHKPALDEFAKVQDTIRLDLQLDITGGENDGGHFPLNGLQLELLQDKINGNAGNRPTLPGADGPYPTLSTGARRLVVAQDASFVGMGGMQHAQLENGCWEMTWREGDPSGALVCGFDVPNELRRNANSPILPTGRIYLNFRLWSHSGLHRMQKWRMDAQRNHDREMELRHSELTKMQNTNNVFMKALHRGNSLAALDRAVSTGVEGLVRDVPLDDDNSLVVLEGGLMLRRDGDVAFEGGEQQGGRSIIGKTTVVLPTGLRP